MRLLRVLALSLSVSAGGTTAAAAASRHNVIIFVADGLRSGMVTPQTAPTMSEVRAKGVDLANSHAMYPTVTTPNASAIATGHRLGDTGDFGNVLYIGAQTSPASPSPFAAVEDDDVIGGLNRRYQGNYLNETSLMAAARQAGFSTASIGKLGPVGVQDVTGRGQPGALIIDDDTGQPDGYPLPADVIAAMRAASLSPVAEDRGLNGSPGSFEAPGVQVANVQQQDWMTGVATKVLLPRFRAAGKPFLMVFWSRDPDGTQHFQGDSLNTLTPGINGATSLAAIRNADTDLSRLREALRRLGLEETTDIVVIADHGFSTISKHSATSPSARRTYADVPPGFLPPGFLAMDLAERLRLPLFDGWRQPFDPASGLHIRTDGALIGPDPDHPLVAVAVNGGSDLLYLPGPPDAHARARAAEIVDWLTQQDYVGAIFVDPALGPLPGALSMATIGLEGVARTPRPSILVSFASVSSGCANPELCAVEVADSTYQQGQGMHGTFSRADTHNFMAAIGPDFKAGYRDVAPVSNADVAPTLAYVLGLDWPSVGVLKGRVISEALDGGAMVQSTARVLRSRPARNGFTTVLDEQAAGGEPYFDAAGMPGRVVGLHP